MGEMWIWGKWGSISDLFHPRCLLHIPAEMLENRWMSRELRGEAGAGDQRSGGGRYTDAIRVRLDEIIDRQKWRQLGTELPGAFNVQAPGKQKEKARVPSRSSQRHRREARNEGEPETEEESSAKERWIYWSYVLSDSGVERNLKRGLGEMQVSGAS